MVLKDFKEIGRVLKKVRHKGSRYAGKSSSAHFLSSDAVCSCCSSRKVDEEELFLRAMEGVVPLKGRSGGREVVPLKHDVQDSPRKREGKGGDPYVQRFLKGKIEFEIEFTDEYMQGNVKGLDPRIFRKLKAGSYSPEAHLDLHGLTSDRAYEVLLEFVRENYFVGKRCLLVVPGRGKNSPLGRGVLREHLQEWITRDPLKRIVLAFSTARPRHGGAGAVYILLRKYKKSHGKIFWQRY